MIMGSSVDRPCAIIFGKLSEMFFKVIDRFLKVFFLEFSRPFYQVVICGAETFAVQSKRYYNRNEYKMTEKSGILLDYLLIPRIR